jgi:hypothetical protein
MTLRFANALTLLAVLTWHSVARAGVCRIEATGSEALGWAEAIASLSELALTEQDCSALRIEVAAGGANVLFTTADGRSAQRMVTVPAELRPSVEALRVRGLDRSAQRAGTSAQASDAERPGVQPPSRPDATALRFALLGGARGSTDLVSPQIVLAASYGLGSFELGVTLSGEPQYFDQPDRRQDSREGGAAALSVQAGTRVVEGAFDLFAGGRTGIGYLITLESRDIGVCPNIIGGACEDYFKDKRTAEWRVGGYAGLAVPHASTLRFRSELSAELAVPGARESPITPGWALSVLLGVELAP